MAPAVCQTCNRQFSKLEHLKRHERSHTRVKPYQCHICHKSYARSDVLFRHCRNHGPDATKSMPERPKRKVGQKVQKRPPQRPLQDPPTDNNSLEGSSSSQRSPNGSQGLPEAAPDWTIIIGPAIQQPSPDASNQSAGSWTHVDLHVDAPSQPNDNNLDHDMPDHILSSVPEGPGESVSISSVTEGYHPNHAATIPQPRLSLPQSAMMHPEVTSIRETDPSLETASIVIPQNGPVLVEETADQPTSRPPEQTFSHVQQVDTPMVLAAASQFSLPHEDWWLSFDDFDIFNGSQNDSALGAQENRPAAPGGDGAIARDSLSRPPPACSGTNHEVTPAPLGKQLPRLQRVWARRSSEASKPMADLWHALSTGEGLFGNLDEGPINFDNRIRRYRTLDVETKQRVCDVFHSILEAERNGPHITSPAPETVEIAYEQYWIHHHNVAPVIHAPTFLAKKAPLDLVVTMCCIGFSVMGTPELYRLVDKAYPITLKRVSELLNRIESDVAMKLTDRLETMITALLAFNLGAINSDRDVFKDVEPTYAALATRLLNRAQKDGLFLADKLPPSLKQLTSLSTEGKRWRVWGGVESVKRLILSLIQLDCWFTFFFAIEPILQIEAVHVMPVCDSDLFEAAALEKWCKMRPDFHQMDYPVISATYSKTPTIARSYDMTYTLLMILQLRFSAAAVVVERATQNGESPLSSPPWKMFGRDIRTKCLVGLTVDLARAANPKDRNFEMNSAVSWHALCMSLCANLRLLETAAGRSDPEAASLAMKEVSIWAGTATARRAALHAAHIFSLLFRRRMCDPVKLHTIISLFQASLVLGFYICTRKHPDSPRVFDIFDDIDWAGIGAFGLTDEPLDLPPWVMELPEAQYIVKEQTLAFEDFIVTSGVTEARKSWLQFASLMMGLGRWKARTFSRILHVMCDNLLEGESAAGGKDG